MERLTRWVLGHRKLVVGIWVLLTVAGIATAGTATERMDQRFTVPGREGWETNQEIARTFKGTGGDTTPLLAVTTVAEGKRVTRDDMAEVEQRLGAGQPGVPHRGLRDHRVQRLRLGGRAHRVRHLLPAAGSRSPCSARTSGRRRRPARR